MTDTSVMTEVLTIAVGFLIVGFAIFLGYRAGKDAAQREASYTVAQLRRAVFVSRKELDELRGRYARLMKQVNG